MGWREAKQGLRIFQANRGISAVAVLMLGIGIGAGTAVFSVINELLLRPRPGIGHGSELVDIGRSQDGSGFDNMSYLNFADLRDRNTSFSGILGNSFKLRPVSLSTGDAGERIYACLVTGNYFSVLQVTPAVGRFFTQEEDRVQGRNAILVLSHAFWKRRFASERDIVGREIRINGHPFLVAGIAPEEFCGTAVLAPDVWIPFHMSEVVIPGSQLTDRRVNVWMLAIGRLRPEVTLGQARAEATAIGAQLEREYPKENRGKNFALTRSGLVPGRLQALVGGFLFLLLILCVLVLAIVCVNVSGVLLARASTRQREFAVRLALGAGRARILRQLLAECLMLFLAGGLAGITCAKLLAGLMLRMVPQLPFPVTVNLDMDWRVWIFALAVSLVAGLLATLAPASQLLRTDVAGSLRDEGQGAGRRRLRLRSALVMGQVALSVILLICGGLFVRSLLRSARIDPGFNSADVQAVTLNFSLAGYQEADGLPASRIIADRIRARPGVQGVAYTWSLPLAGESRSLSGIEVPGYADATGSPVFDADWSIVTPGYFALLNIPLLRGRDFTDADTESSRPVAIINETMAQRFWPRENPVGRHFLATRGPGDGKQPVEIIGVARNHKYRSLAAKPVLFVHVPMRQNYMPEMTLLARAEPAIPIVAEVRSVLREVNPYLPIVHAQPLGEYAQLALFPQRLAGGLAWSLGLLGLLLTSMGIYGVTAFFVAQRTREIGIRMALGAQGRDVLRMVLWQGLRLTAVGMIAGLGAALSVTRLFSELLIGIGAHDPITFLGVPLLLGSVAAAATWIPALRATRIEPMRALRHE